MKIAIAPLALVGMLLACAFAGAQGQAPKPMPTANTSPSAGTPAAPAPSERQRADTHADARVCLEFPNDMQVIACAEKYRSGRSR
jgi:hypothetical protein